MSYRQMLASGVTQGDVLIDKIKNLEIEIGRTEEIAVTAFRHTVKLYDTSDKLVRTLDANEYVTVRRTPVPATS